GLTGGMVVFQRPPRSHLRHRTAGNEPVTVAPACSTVKGSPATIRLPDRAAPRLAATWYVTQPLPVPDEAPLRNVAQLTTLEEVQEHQLAAVTLTDPAPPAAGKACSAALRA